MLKKLKALFVVAGALLIGSTVYTLAILRPGFSVADALDAGILQVSVPMQLQCRARIRSVCKRADGGAFPAYVLANIKARKVTSDAGDNLLLLDVPDAPDGTGACLRPVGTLSEACTIVEDGACTDNTVCCANCLPQAAQDACACRRAAGACVRADGGVAPFGVTLEPGWSGAGCQRKYCGPEVAGEQGQSWPAVCPGG